MSGLKVGHVAPDFTLPTDKGGEITLSSLKGRKVVIFFYPKDDTPGCTAESCAFRDAFSKFEELNTRIIGISKCSIKKHDKFKEKYNLNYPLASDEKSNTCEKYGVWVEKSMYGKKYMGIERSTFLIDENGIIQDIWRKVSVPNHIESVLQALDPQAQAA